jgi:phenylacetate-CoA ligase
MTPSLAFGDYDAACREYEFARKNVPFFRERDGEAAARGGFDRIPPTTKADYRANFPMGIIAEGRRPTDTHVQRLQSSGTEGDRLSTVVYEFLLAERMWRCLTLNRDLKPLLDIPRIRTCRYAAPNCSDVECANPRATRDDRILPDGTLVLPVHHDLLTTPDSMIETALREMAEYRPDLIYTDPTHFAFLVRSARRLGVEAPIPAGAAIVLTYSFATQVALRQIRGAAQGRGNAVAAAISMSEFGYLGIECHCGTLHLNSADFYLELIPAGAAAEDGEPLLELAVTSLGDRLCPHVRYLTGDLYRLAGGCPCGTAMPGVRLEGRRKDSGARADGSLLTPRAIDTTVGPRRWIDAYQIGARGPGEHDFHFIGDPAAEDGGDAEDLRHALESLLDRRVRVARATYLPSARGGKFMTVRAGR